jgi:hypothetical protein
VVPSVTRYAYIAAALMLAVVLVERGHRVSIEAPMPAEIAFREAIAACPTSDSVPYTVRCLAYLGSSSAPPQRRVSLHEGDASIVSSSRGGECPDNDNRPYPPGCVRYMSGPFWQVN